MTDEQKTLVKKAKNDFNLHVALILRDVPSKADAIVIAYAEGKAGFDRRFGGIAAPVKL